MKWQSYLDHGNSFLQSLASVLSITILHMATETLKTSRIRLCYGERITHEGVQRLPGYRIMSVSADWHEDTTWLNKETGE